MTRAALTVYESKEERRARQGRVLGVVLEHPTGAAVEWRFTPQGRAVRTTAFRTRMRVLADAADLNHWWQRVPALSLYGLPPGGVPALASFAPNQFVTPREWMTRSGLGDYSSTNVALVADETDVGSLYRGILTGTQVFAPTTFENLPNRVLITELHRPGVDPVSPDGFTIAHAEATIAMLMDGIVGYSYDEDRNIVAIRAPRRLRDVLPDRGDREARVEAIADRMLGR